MRRISFGQACPWQGDTKDAEKAAKMILLKKSTKAGMTQTREAALQILLAAKARP